MTLLAASQIAVIAPDGAAVPFDSPSSAIFFGRRLIVANQAFISGDTSHMAILDTWIGTCGRPELIPPEAGFRKRHRT